MLTEPYVITASPNSSSIEEGQVICYLGSYCSLCLFGQLPRGLITHIPVGLSPGALVGPVESALATEGMIETLLKSMPRQCG